MAHIEVNTFLNKIIEAIEPFYQNSRILEIGSYDVNGSVRSNFKNAKEYVGVDLMYGPSVDVVSKGHLYTSKAKFDVVLSVESFEHNSYWIETFINMVNHLDDDGVLIFTCATQGRLEHGTHRTDPLSSPGTSSSDDSYYMNLVAEDFINIKGFNKMFITCEFYVNNITKDLYFYGLKGGGKIDADKMSSYFKSATEASAKVRRKIGYMSYLKVRAFYLLMFPLYSFMSDKSYQNITYSKFKMIRYMLAKLDGFVK